MAEQTMIDRLVLILGDAKYIHGIAMISSELVDEIIVTLKEGQAAIDKLTPYALAQIARLRYASISDELEDAEDEQERRAVASELANWDQTTLRAIELMEAQWERDRKTLLRVELADMVKASVAKGGR